MVANGAVPKRHYGRFLSTIFVAGLTFVPFDLGPTVFLWMGGVAAAFWAVIQLMGSGVQLLAGDRLHWPTAVVAPLLTIAFLPLAVIAESFSFGVATEFGARTALEIQSECRVSICPATLEGWGKDKFGCASWIRSGYFIGYYVCYARSEDGLSFSLRLRRYIDYNIYWKGGKHVALQRRNDKG